jgi:multiple sugar transport system substrate-binding protein
MTRSRFRRRTSVRLITAMAVAGLVLAGCGKASDTSSGGGSDSSGGTITLWTHNAGNPLELGVVNQIVKDYNASQTKYKVVVQAFPQASYNDAVVAAATAKKLPCILDTDAPTVPNWAYAGYLAPLDLPADVVNAQLPSTLGNYKGKLYSVGYYDAALGLFARGDALKAAGIRVATIDKPWTATEFNTALTKLKATGKFKYVLDLGTGDPGTEWWTYGYSPFLQSFGGDLIDRNGYKTAEGVINGPKALAWATWFQGLVKQGYSPAKSGTDAFADFVNGKSAMVWSGIWNSANLDKVKGGVVMPPPDFGNGPKIGGGSWQWAISSACSKALGALDYLKFSLTPKYESQFAVKQSVIPATEAAAQLTPGWKKGETKRFFLDESQKFALIRPPTPGYPFLTTTFAKAAQDIIAGGNPKKILDQAAKDIDDNLKSNDNYGY